MLLSGGKPTGRLWQVAASRGGWLTALGSQLPLLVDVPVSLTLWRRYRLRNHRPEGCRQARLRRKYKHDLTRAFA